MKKMFLIVVLSFLLLHSYFAQNAYAIDLSVTAPQGTLTEGQAFDFDVNVDTQGASLNTLEFYVTYDTRYVQFQDGGFLAGDFFDTASYTKVEDGKLYVKAESTTPKTGTGLVAVVKLKIIATAPGTAQICAAEVITPTPSLAPTTVVPTSMPVTGSVGNLLGYSLFGVSFIIAAALMKRML